MAASNSSRSRGIHVQEMPWGCFSRGAREALIQHGITLEAPFPGDPGEKKTTCKAIDQQGREITIRRSSKTTFTVSRRWGEEEKAWYDRLAAKKAEDGWAILGYFDSLAPAEKEVYIAECEPHLAAVLRKWLANRPTSGNRAKEIKPQPAKIAERFESNLIAIDFKPYDILAELERLREMVEAGEINGLLFAAKYTKPGKHRHFFGASGRYSENIDEALAAAVLLQNELAAM